MHSSQDTSFPLLSLPSELILKTLDHLDFRALVPCRTLSRLFRKIIDEDVNLQHKIELAAANMEEGSQSGLSTAVRLDLLKRHQAAWNKLEWTSHKSLQILGGHVWELYGGVFAQAKDTHNTIFFRQLPSALRGIEEKEWEISIVEFQIRDFTIDPAQDLLVAVVNPVVVPSPGDSFLHIAVQLRSMTTGGRHPLASNPPVLVHNTSLVNNRLTFIIQICADIVAVMFTSNELFINSGSTELVLWNWKTGCKVMNIHCDDDMASFAFLSSRYLLVGMNCDPITTIAQPTLIVLDIEDGTEARANFHDINFVCSFQYPRLSPSLVPLVFSIRSDPSPDWTSPPGCQLPFWTARQHRLYVISLVLSDDEGNISSFDSFVPTDTLLSCLRTLDDGEDLRQFEWEEWGPEGTRLMTSPRTSNVWVCYVFGMKFVSLRARGISTMTGPDKEYIVDLYDFNHLVLSRAESTGGTPGEDEEWITAPSIVSGGLFATREVRTSLPYRIIKRSLPEDVIPGRRTNAVMCSEDGLILVADDPDDRKFHVLSF
ncbi:hypothetical protein SERLA73DRAFT_174170 [Serpula lacrymans var. lacrymans S7.3]|uniref:F-box domain-containing protein n=2 Tax=Serpula lacrymans var. lacrymans TaxID=341189 RepID=F8PIE6_SERL3|nr:uncharacterized protein SERLADRAFT_455271 [Serpula lacrymans var. lacrymans S7.9]EGO05189.1 hypothetical protein SERLA73DRAFT_174170 [Serpula lacrymans var. lacrymans S7.3]EGO30929.1 hypothetical protein SERLADRAFT_455271 [Serpula lacrymans var. lacrymans S7.9]